jgi:16S rRNA (guanine527-N7)-methyltransferase
MMEEYGLTDKQTEKIEAFYQMHMEATLNLTAIKDKEDFYTKHVADSFWLYRDKSSILKGDVADIGTGGGFPGVILAILYPDLKFSLVDSIAKKCRFLEEAVEKLGLKNVEIINSRSEEIKNKKFKTIVSRGVAKIDMMVKYTWNIADADCVWVLYKGENADDEINAASQILNKRKLEYINVRYDEPIKRTYTILYHSSDAGRLR